MELSRPKKSGVARFLRGVASGIRRFSVSFGFAVAGTLLFALCTLNLNPPLKLDETFGIMALIAAGAGMATAAALQLYFEGRKTVHARLWEVLVSIPVSIVLFFLLYLSSDKKKLIPTQLNGTFVLIAFGVILFMILVGMTIVTRRSTEGSAIRSAVFGVFFAQILFSIVFAAFVIFYLAIDTLIVDLDDNLPLVIACFSFLCVGLMVFLSFLPEPDQERNPNKAYSILFTYVLTPLFLVLILILYAYLIRILILWQLPSGELNPFGMAALAVFLILWLALRGETSAFARWFTRFGGLFVLPITAMQIVGLWVRINAYGLTPLRTASLFLICLGLIGILYSVLNLPSYRFFRAAACLVLVAMISPLNVFQISNFEQTQRLKPILARYEMILPDGTLRKPVSDPDREDRDRIISGFEYFRSAEGVLTPFEQQVAAQGGPYTLIGVASSDTDYSYRKTYYNFIFRKTSDLTEEPLVLPADTSLYYISQLSAETPDYPLETWTDPVSGKALSIDLIGFAKQVLKESGQSDMDQGEVQLIFPIDETHTLLVTHLWIACIQDADYYDVSAEDCWMLVQDANP